MGVRDPGVHNNLPMSGGCSTSFVILLLSKARGVHTLQRSVTIIQTLSLSPPCTIRSIAGRFGAN